MLGGLAGEFVVALTIADEAHVFSPRRGIAPWAPGSETGKGQQHPEAVAMRSMEGGNSVDEVTLALGDCEANLAHEGED